VKINVEVDCTPEEARRAMGLPDLSPVHDRYVQMMVEAIEKQGTPEGMADMIRNWGPMGESAMSFWRTMFESGVKKSG
jgi:3-methyladenine DNA glycosylase/8-oxoguanine DNA glycosylase